MPDAHAPWPEPEHILLILNFLRTRLGETGLEEIDGDFYWYCCRADLLESLRTCRTQYPSFTDPIPDHTSPAAQLLYLRHALAWAVRLRDIFDELFDSYPLPVFERLITGAPVPVRVPEAFRCWEDDGTVCRVRVYSGVTTGAEVEQALRDLERQYGGSAWGEPGLAIDRDEWVLPPDNPPRSPRGRILALRNGDPNVVCLAKFVEFHLVEGPAYSGEREPVCFPYVEVVVHSPPPPPGTIAHDFDQVVCEDRQWHLRLPGAGTTQEKEVALRTWGVGLLMGCGLGFDEAMRRVCEQMETPEVSQACFGNDRRRLLERVPEAQPYLYARKETIARLAKAARARGPLQSREGADTPVES
jgi:hypothetical protein